MLTIAQKSVIRRMQNGWKWHRCDCIRCRQYQHEHLGVVVYVSEKTTDALVRDGYLRRYSHYDFVLTERGIVWTD